MKMFSRKFNKSSRRHHQPPDFLAQAQNQLSDGPYRPRRLPRPSKPGNWGVFVILLVTMLLAFSFAHVWKAHAVNQLCSRMDSLRNRQQGLQERLRVQQLIFIEATMYSRVEPLARERLGMLPASSKPVVIAPWREGFGAVQNASAGRLEGREK